MPKRASRKNPGNQIVSTDAEKLKLFTAVLEDLRDHGGCDEMRHRNKLPCYSCIAERALKGVPDPWIQGESRNAPFQLDEMPAGRYYALISGYHDWYGVGFHLMPITAKINVNVKNVWDMMPKNKRVDAYSKDCPSDKLGRQNNTSLSAGCLLEIEVLATGGYNIIQMLRRG